jgi:hypothetical protein
MSLRSTLLTAGRCRKVGPANTDNMVDRKEPFPFLKLPAELREQIYLIALQPITPVDTAASSPWLHYQ